MTASVALIEALREVKACYLPQGNLREEYCSLPQEERLAAQKAAKALNEAAEQAAYDAAAPQRAAKKMALEKARLDELYELVESAESAYQHEAFDYAPALKRYGLTLRRAGDDYIVDRDALDAVASRIAPAVFAARAAAKAARAAKPSPSHGEASLSDGDGNRPSPGRTKVTTRASLRADAATWTASALEELFARMLDAGMADIVSAVRGKADSVSAARYYALDALGVSPIPPQGEREAALNAAIAEARKARAAREEEAAFRAAARESHGISRIARKAPEFPPVPVDALFIPTCWVSEDGLAVAVDKSTHNFMDSSCNESGPLAGFSTPGGRRDDVTTTRYVTSGGRTLCSGERITATDYSIEYVIGEWGEKSILTAQPGGWLPGILSEEKSHAAPWEWEDALAEREAAKAARAAAADEAAFASADSRFAALAALRSA